LTVFQLVLYEAPEAPRERGSYRDKVYGVWSSECVDSVGPVLMKVGSCQDLFAQASEESVRSNIEIGFHCWT